MKRIITVVVDDTGTRLSSITEQLGAFILADRYLSGVVTEMRFKDDGQEVKWIP